MNNKWAENSSSWQRKRNILLNCQFELQLTEVLHRPEPGRSSALQSWPRRAEIWGWNEGKRIPKTTDNQVNPQWTKNCFPGWGYFCLCSLVGCINNLFLILLIHLWVDQSSWNPGSSTDQWEHKGEMASLPASALQENLLFYLSLILSVKYRVLAKAKGLETFCTKCEMRGCVKIEVVHQKNLGISKAQEMGEAPGAPLQSTRPSFVLTIIKQKAANYPH